MSFISREYEKIQKLGEGFYGEVSKVKNYSDGKFYILKKPKGDILRAQGSFRRELKILEYIKPVCNPYLQCINKVSIKKYINYILSEYKDAVDLSKFLSKVIVRKKIHHKYPEFTPKQQLVIMKQLLEGLFKLHKIGVVHRDIKPDNILIKNIHSLEELDQIVNSGEPFLSYIDFGIACLKDDKECLNLHSGSPLWCAPEIYDMHNVDFNFIMKTDIWSLGAVFIEIFFQNFKKPIKDDDVFLKLTETKDIIEYYQNLRLPQYSITAPIIMKMMVENKDRPSAKELLEKVNQALSKLDQEEKVQPVQNMMASYRPCKRKNSIRKRAKKLKSGKRSSRKSRSKRSKKVSNKLKQKRLFNKNGKSK